MSPRRGYCPVSWSDVSLPASVAHGGVVLVLVDLLQGVAFVHRDVVGFVASDLVLRVVLGAMPLVAFVLGVAGVLFHDGAADLAGF